MNIFYLDRDPVIAAQMMCDKHVVKMILESAQMLSTVLRQHGYDGDTYIYGQTHVKHPSTIWAGKTRANFDWLLEHALALCREYTARYGKFHKSEAILYRCGDLRDFIPEGSLTVPPKCMGLEYKVGTSNWDDVVSSYRKYYRLGKNYMNKGNGPQWKKIPTRKPSWF